jgi:hypothetical protein
MAHADLCEAAARIEHGTLICPRCGYSYLHRADDYTDFSRPVAFWCEGCFGRLELTIREHKGQVFVTWAVEPSLADGLGL